MSCKAVKVKQGAFTFNQRHAQMCDKCVTIWAVTIGRFFLGLIGIFCQHYTRCKRYFDIREVEEEVGPAEDDVIRRHLQHSLKGRFVFDVFTLMTLC